MNLEIPDINVAEAISKMAQNEKLAPMIRGLVKSEMSRVVQKTIQEDAELRDRIRETLLGTQKTPEPPPGTYLRPDGIVHAYTALWVDGGLVAPSGKFYGPSRNQKRRAA